MVPYYWEIGCGLLIVIITYIHYRIYKANIKIGPWFHLWWSFVYSLPLIYIFLHYHPSPWLLLLSLLLERLVLYNPILNTFRGYSIFHIVSDTSKPGLWDKIEVAWGELYPYILGLAAASFVYLQFNLKPLNHDSKIQTKTAFKVSAFENDPHTYSCNVVYFTYKKFVRNT